MLHCDLCMYLPRVAVVNPFCIRASTNRHRAVRISSLRDLPSMSLSVIVCEPSGRCTVQIDTTLANVFLISSSCVIMVKKIKFIIRSGDFPHSIFIFFEI